MPEHRREWILPILNSFRDGYSRRTRVSQRTVTSPYANYLAKPRTEDFHQ